jgi:GNAT superfamily N-acetyltransferase
MRRAFGTYLGVPSPEQSGADADILASRWTADPSRVFAAVYDSRLVGTCVATNWGSLGFLGPLTVDPEFWDRSVGQALLHPVMEQFASWGTRHIGLFTFAQSPKHLHLYEKFGFYPRFLTQIMSKAPALQASPPASWALYSGLTEGERPAALTACRAVSDAVYSGLDLTREIEAAQAQRLGDTVLLLDGSQVVGFAVCHCGGGTEAGNGSCYVKFGALQPGGSGEAADQRFSGLLAACEALAASRGLSRVSGGVNLGCDAAYGVMRRRGYRTDTSCVAMQQPNEAEYNRSDRYVISDWR